jgi:hypothetical protein
MSASLLSITATSNQTKWQYTLGIKIEKVTDQKALTFSKFFFEFEPHCRKYGFVHFNILSSFLSVVNVDAFCAFVSIPHLAIELNLYEINSIKL